MELKDMKLPPRKKTPEEQRYPTMCAEGDDPRYPYGLRLHLDEAQVKALGLTELPKAGVSITLEAKGDVCSTGETQMQKEGTERSLDIQITALGLSS